MKLLRAILITFFVSGHCTTFLAYEVGTNFIIFCHISYQFPRRNRISEDIHCIPPKNSCLWQQLFEEIKVLWVFVGKPENPGFGRV